MNGLWKVRDRRLLSLGAILALGCLWPPAVMGAALDTEISPNGVSEPARHDAVWDRLDRLLDSRVENGLVRYQGLEDDPVFLAAWKEMSRISAEELAGWPHEERLAFWINAYNLATLKLIVDHYPIEGRFPLSLFLPDNSILMVPGRWKGNYFTFAGRELSLDEIEHQVLRGEFQEPRIHFAIVCASIGCPVLRSEAFRGSQIDIQLEDQARVYFSLPTGLRIERDGSRVELTKILDWFGEDFDLLDPDPLVLLAQRREKRGRLLAVIARWVPEEVRQRLRSERVRTGWISYDWNLNEWVE